MRTFLLFGLASTSILLANPQDPSIIAGHASFSESTSGVLEIATSDVAILNWKSFSIEEGEITRFLQPSAQSAVLNRVTGIDPSQLKGLLEAKGSVYLVNPNGVFITPTAVIQTNNFISQTFEIADADFLSHDFSNGVFYVPPPVNEIDPPFATAIRLEGQISALNVQEQGGRFYLMADTVEVRGSIEAPSGEVRLIGNSIRLTESAQIDVGSGQVHIGGGAHGMDQNIPNASYVVVESGSHIRANAGAEGNGGNIVVWSDRGTTFLGTAEAKGGIHSGDGGLIEISGKQFLDYRGLANTLAPSGKVGSLLLDPIDITVIIPPGMPTNVATSGTNPLIFTPTASPSTIDPTTINSNLATTHVIVESSGAAGSEQGNLTISSVILNDALNDLTFRTTGTPSGNILIQANVFGTSVGKISFESSGSTTLSGASVIVENGNLTFDVGGDFTVGTATSAADSIIRSIGTANLVMNVGGNFAMNATAAFEPTINTTMTGSITLNVGGDALLTSTATQFCNLTSNTSNIIDVGGDFLICPTNIGRAFVISEGNLIVNVGGDLLLGGNSSPIENDGSIGSVLAISVGGDFTMLDDTLVNQNDNAGMSLDIGGNLSILGSTGFTYISSAGGGPLLIDVGGNLFATGDGTIDASLTNSVDIRAGGSIEIQEQFEFSFPSFHPVINLIAGGDIIFGPTDTGLSSNSDNSTNLVAGRNIVMQGTSFCETTESGGVNMTAGGSILLLDTARVESMLGGNLNLIADAAHPSPPSIGSSSFVILTTPTGSIKIFTARREQNSVEGNIRGVLFVPGPEFVNSATEMWGIYSPHNSGFPYTIFYKNIFIPKGAIAAFNVACYEYLQWLPHFDRLYFRMKEFQAIVDAELVQPLFYPNNPMWFHPSYEL
jgi:filamentous hemagglutinin family protein